MERASVECFKIMEDKSFWELVLHYGLFIGGIFQLICILAIVVIPSDKSAHENDALPETDSKSRKVHSQTTVQSQTRLKWEKKKKR